MPRDGAMSNERIAKNLDDIAVRLTALRGMLGERACNHPYIGSVFSRLGKDAQDYEQIAQQLRRIP